MMLQTPVSARAAYERSLHETPALHSGARLAAKLKAKIIVNDTEFNHAEEMSVNDRHLYHEALESVFHPSIAVSSTEPREISQNKVLLIVSILRNSLSRAAGLLRLTR